MTQTQSETSTGNGFLPLSPEQGRGRRFTVRFQQTSLYTIDIEASSAEEADQVAFELFKANPAAATLLRADFGHRTIEATPTASRED